MDNFPIVERLAFADRHQADRTRHEHDYKFPDSNDIDLIKRYVEKQARKTQTNHQTLPGPLDDLEPAVHVQYHIHPSSLAPRRGNAVDRSYRRWNDHLGYKQGHG